MRNLKLLICLLIATIVSSGVVKRQIPGLPPDIGGETQDEGGDDVDLQDDVGGEGETPEEDDDEGESPEDDDEEGETPEENDDEGETPEDDEGESPEDNDEGETQNEIEDDGETSEDADLVNVGEEDVRDKNKNWRYKWFQRPQQFKAKYVNDQKEAMHGHGSASKFGKENKQNMGTGLFQKLQGTKNYFHKNFEDKSK